MARPPDATGAAASEMQQLEATMAQFLHHDSAVRAAAEARLQQFLRTPTAGDVLLQVTTASALPEVRGQRRRTVHACLCGRICRCPCVL